MKRGWIHWEEAELPRAAFEARLRRAQQALAERDLPALAVYTDIWRSNQVRHFSNFMPYWNRALLVIPREGPPTLLCGLSPRVYPWIRSVTILDEIRPSPNLAQQALQLAAEKGWSKLGVLDLAQLPYDLHQQIHGGSIEVVSVSLPSAPDEWELSMYRRAAQMARDGLSEELAAGVGISDHEFTGRLERKFRRAGAEDLMILLTNGRTAPAPPRSETLGADFSISLALEYRGHWVKVARSASPRDPVPVRMHVENLSNSYPYAPSARLEASAILAIRFESRTRDLRRFHGDTYWSGSEGLTLL
jgi:hypothetical protein